MKNSKHVSELESYLGRLPEPILDLGSGKGKVLIAFVKKGYRAIGIEPFELFRRTSVEFAKKYGVRIEVLAGTAENMPLPDGSIGFVNAGQVIEHVESPKKMLSEIHRVLKDGGKAYISVVNRFAIKEDHYRLWFINWMPRRWSVRLLAALGRTKKDGGDSGKNRLDTMHYFTYGEFVEFARPIGYEVLDLRLEKLRKRGSWLRSIYWFVMPWYCSNFHFLLEKKGAQTL